MKTTIKMVLLSAIGATVLQGCDPYLYPTTTYNYQINNQPEVSEAVSYTNDNSEFKMTPELTYSPLLSREGQVNAQIEFGDITEGHLAVALNSNSALLFGFGGGSFSSEAAGKVHLNGGYDGYNSNGILQHYTIDGTYVFKRKNECSSTFGEVAYGRYKVVNKSFRRDLFIGTRLGKTSNNYSVEADAYAFNNYNSPFRATYDDTRRHASLFLQYGFGLFKEHVELSASARVNGYLFTSRDANADLQDFVPDYSKTVFSFNPAIRFGFGGRGFRMFFQYSGALPFASKHTDWYRQSFNGGVTFMFRDQVRVEKVKP